MSWSDYWIERARLSAKRQRRLYGLEVPHALVEMLQAESPRLGFTGAARVAIFTLLSPLRGRLRLFWHRLVDRDTPAELRKIESLARDLRARLSEQCRITSDSFERQHFSRDMARVPGFLEKALYRTRPFLVVQLRNERDVIETLAFARESRVPVIPRGISSSAFGGAVPTRNGIVLDFSSMNDIIEVDPLQLRARVQPGVRWSDLASHLERRGLAPLTTPSSRFSTVAGWASTGGLGMDGFGYGHFSQAVAGARVALMDGRILSVNGEGEGLQEFLGKEGQLGIFTELTLRVRKKPGMSSPRIAYFHDARAAFDFVNRLIAGGYRPSHLVFYDRGRLAEENRLFRDRTGRDQPIVEERDAVLLHFDAPDAERRLLEAEASGLLSATQRSPAARYLWTERFFPLKAQRLGPGLLAAEVVLSRAAAAGFVYRARRIVAHFGMRPAIEAIVSRLSDGTEACVVIVFFSCDPGRRWSYLLRLLLVQILLHAGLRMGGRPYGLGIWNAPFVGSCYPSVERRRLLRRKQELDPHHLLNPNKFFSVRTRFLNIPGLFFRPTIFRIALRLATALSPLLGAVGRLGRSDVSDRWQIPAAEEEDGAQLMAQAAVRCTSCGSCVSACPAYLLTRDERVTGRAKLRLAESWMSGQEIRANEAHRIFQCVLCGLCEEVCQTRLPLRDCYRVLERWIQKRYGYPAELIRGFVERLDADRSLIRATFGLDLPDWSSDGKLPVLEQVQRSMEAAS